VNAVEELQGASFQMLPNPATLSVVVRTAAGTSLQNAWICDLAGRKLGVSPVLEDNGSFRFDLRALSSGLYQMMIQTSGGEVKSLKLVKE
jgi:hypothetical protein